MDPQILLFSNCFIKNGSYDTIHIFKNYFATLFSVSVTISSIQIDPKEVVLVLDGYSFFDNQTSNRLSLNRTEVQMDYIIPDLLSNNGRGVLYPYYTVRQRFGISGQEVCCRICSPKCVTKPLGAESTWARLCALNDLLDGHWCCTML